jgi:cytoskeletal protein CcmA (bactofilin family)
MDPSEIQEDKSNDSHSLENGGGDAGGPEKKGADAPVEATVTKSEDGKTQTTDASGGAAPDPVKAKKDESFIKKFWHKFNIYLVLFILVMILAVGVVVILTVKSKNDAQKTIGTTGLTQDALTQLANTDVTVGDAKQILTVQSNAVFAGSVLIRSNLEIAGALKVGGELALTSLKVSGQAQLNDTSVNNLTVAGTLTLQGVLTIKNGINVNGNSNFSGNVTTTSLTTGQLQLNGDLNLTHHVTAGGTIPAATRGTAVGGGGSINLSGSDTAGSISISTGAAPPAGCFVNVTFSQKFSGAPHVSIAPIGSTAGDLTYYVDRSTTGFSICSTTPAPANQTFGFDYVILD